MESESSGSEHHSWEDFLTRVRRLIAYRERWSWSLAEEADQSVADSMGMDSEHDSCHTSMIRISNRTLPAGSNENTAEMEFHNHYMHTAHGKHRTTSGDIETGQ